MKNHSSETDFENSLDVRLQLPGIRPELFLGERAELANHPGSVETAWRLRDGSEFKQMARITVSVVNGHCWLMNFNN